MGIPGTEPVFTVGLETQHPAREPSLVVMGGDATPLVSMPVGRDANLIAAITSYGATGGVLAHNIRTLNITSLVNAIHKCIENRPEAGMRVESATNATVHPDLREPERTEVQSVSLALIARISEAVQEKVVATLASAK